VRGSVSGGNARGWQALSFKYVLVPWGGSHGKRAWRPQESRHGRWGGSDVRACGYGGNTVVRSAQVGFARPVSMWHVAT
jgi:hypothetical protein